MYTKVPLSSIKEDRWLGFAYYIMGAYTAPGTEERHVNMS